jgi:pimeloyl-ACP methyl ester carboxylesterase
MAHIEVHLFPGFLGSPRDWSAIVERLENKIEGSMQCHDWLSLYRALGNDRSLTAVAEVVASKVRNPSAKVAVIGYSMGGRVLMHLPPDSYDHMLLLAAHPGLQDGREARRQLDQQWVQQAELLGQERWLRQWNQQDVFKNDRVRPHRDFASQDFACFLEMIQDWSLANQEPQWNRLQETGQKVFWACGADDVKFLDLVEPLRKTLPRDHVQLLADAGHGVIFDQPQKVASWVRGVLQSV